MRIQTVTSNIEREPLLKPFGFKGSYMSEIWQSVAGMESSAGLRAAGVGTQGVLWSDAAVFAQCSEAAGNSLMYLMTEHALRLAAGTAFETPFELLDALLPQVHRYGQKITGRKPLRQTFALNALVPVDNAAWMLHAAEHRTESLDALLPPACRDALAQRPDRLAVIPLISYGVSVDEIRALMDAGHFFLKVKIGSDPAKDGDPEKMLAWDKERLSAVHALARERQTPHTPSGHIPYYLDANGRYDSKDRLMRLLDHARSIGALERIVIVEEPFPEDYRTDVRDIPVRLAADESAHTDKDALERIEMGYGAIALKPIAKTLSMSLRIAQLAQARHVPCFCADLTVNPILLDWNKSIAARLQPLPGIKVGAMETNGHQNYRNWTAMQGYHPMPDAEWTRMRGGMFTLGPDFYTCSGGIFRSSPHYQELLGWGPHPAA